ncbi:2-keto-3-deoxy-6-phosphogluconate aldolase [Helicobacter bizzozeronii]|uniref:bifunctional 4-hydroxy-2-oxoglutarate aldolase/2-dehydro-3-deoxy-phosphogluconate aldolase n=1 Tax=Helicobacter bizzozeronii TaxID=56877 RepID=UPI00244D8BDD|nr:bifunctional 4-hydroxy-2-oxoglutarate aldolase/2-dehydro-3-deoxy-phosphogluconate aldolase [Helicobacter bizzozeronii]GMB92662.1 2-keto-3-deoxy-6-phosphogluconate aldolase [Helicobacter bizzozeronii]
MNSHQVLSTSPIVPVMVIEHAKDAVPLARALVAGGIKILEITLRTKQALESIRLIAKEVPEALVGAGTILNAQQLEEAQKAGARFAISPGLTPLLAKEAKQFDLPLIPGVAGASELMLALEHGFTHLKFFPAQAAGGVGMLKSLSGPFEGVYFCPTGGISLENMHSYLALKNVLCVGGSWLAPKDLVANGKWENITQIAQESLGMLQKNT